MPERKKPLPWVAIIFVGLLVYALAADFAKKQPIIFWVVIVVSIGGLVFILWKSVMVRQKLWGAVKYAATDLSYTMAGGRERKSRVPIPQRVRESVERRARGKCENPDCSEKLLLWYHHVDKNPNNNNVGNLALLCRNCAAKADTGAFKKETVKRWTDENYRRLRSHQAS